MGSGKRWPFAGPGTMSCLVWWGETGLWGKGATEAQAARPEETASRHQRNLGVRVGNGSQGPTCVHGGPYDLTH